MKNLMTLLLSFNLVMSDDNESDRKRRHEFDGQHVEDPPDLVKKRPRGPSDCLDDDSEEEDFVPFTQISPEVVCSPEKKKVFAKKSMVKRSYSKGSGGKKSIKKTGNSKMKATTNFSGSNL